jgi:hypothetical protein
MILLVMRHNRHSVSVDVGLFVAGTQHLSNLAQLIGLKLSGNAFLDYLQLLQQNDAVGVIGHLETVRYLYNRAARVMLLQELHDRPFPHKRWSILDHHYLWLADQHTKNSNFLSKASSKVLVDLLDIRIQSLFIKAFKILVHTQLLGNLQCLFFIEVGTSPA